MDSFFSSLSGKSDEDVACGDDGSSGVSELSEFLNLSRGSLRPGDVMAHTSQVGEGVEARVDSVDDLSGARTREI